MWYGVVTLMSQFYMQKFDNEDLSGYLVQSGFLCPKKATAVIRQYLLSGNLEVDWIEYDEDMWSDWLYQN
jgi:hypothetical protein